MTLDAFLFGNVTKYQLNDQTFEIWLYFIFFGIIWFYKSSKDSSYTCSSAKRLIGGHQ